MLEKKLASEHVSEEEQMNLLKDLERKETEYMRLKRHKICVDDFDLLTIIGRGAFGEVRHAFFIRCPKADLIRLIKFFFPKNLNLHVFLNWFYFSLLASV